MFFTSRLHHSTTCVAGLPDRFTSHFSMFSTSAAGRFAIWATSDTPSAKCSLIQSFSVFCTRSGRPRHQSMTVSKLFPLLAVSNTISSCMSPYGLFASVAISLRACCFHWFVASSVLSPGIQPPMRLPKPVAQPPIVLPNRLPTLPRIWPPIWALALSESLPRKLCIAASQLAIWPVLLSPAAVNDVQSLVPLVFSGMVGDDYRPRPICLPRRRYLAPIPRTSFRRLRTFAASPVLILKGAFRLALGFFALALGAALRVLLAFVLVAIGNFFQGISDSFSCKSDEPFKWPS